MIRNFREGPGGDGTTHSHFAPLRVRVLAPSALDRANALGRTHCSEHYLHLFDGGRECQMDHFMRWHPHEMVLELA